MKKFIKWFIILVLFGGISYGLYSFSQPKTATVDMAAGQEELTFPVTKETLVKTVAINGKSSYVSETIVYAPFNGKVSKWNVKDGQQIKRGDSLFQLDPGPIQEEIARAEAEIKKQKLEEKLANFQREIAEDEGAVWTESSTKQRAAKKEELRMQQEITTLNRSLQEKEIAQKQEKIEQAIYTAPVGGIFLYDDAAKLPQMVQENMRIGKIVDMNQLQLITYVGEQDIFSLKPGMSVQVQLTAHKDIKLNGDVVKVSKFAKTGTDGTVVSPAQFEVIVSLAKNPNLIAGLSLNGDVEIERKDNAVVVPTIAVMKDSNGTYVMLKGPNGSTRQPIKVGMETPDKTEVLEGLKPGDTVTLQ